MTYEIESLALSEKIRLQKASNRIPQGDGVNFVEYRDIPLTEIKTKVKYGKTKGFANLVRAKGLRQENVNAFEFRIKTGKYSFVYDQPVVIQLPDGSYELVCGEHRYQAHKNLVKTMFCAVVTFDSVEAKILFQSNENDEESEFIKNVRTSDDVIVTLSNLYQNGSITDLNDDNVINDFLRKLNQLPNHWKKIREEFRAEHGIAAAVKTYDNDARKEWVSENKSEEEIEWSTRSVANPVNGVAYISKTFKGGSGKGGVKDLDYDIRCFFDALQLLEQEGVDQVVNVASINDATAKKVGNIRDYKNAEMVKEWTDKVIKYAKLIQNPEEKLDPIKQIKFLWCPQINRVDDMEDWA